MKVTTYSLDGKTCHVEYDEKAPCRLCGQPVVEASMGGTDICPWCDMGVSRPGVYGDGYAALCAKIQELDARVRELEGPSAPGAEAPTKEEP